MGGPVDSIGDWLVRVPCKYDIFQFVQICYCPGESYKKNNTEERANVVAAVWGTEFIQFLAVLAILHMDELKNKMNCIRMI